MPTLRLTVKFVNPPKEGKKRGSIKGTDDTFLLVFPDDLHWFEPGKTYDIVYTQVGDWKTVKSATAVEASPQKPTSTAAPSAPTGRPESLSGGELKDEQIFTCALLKEGIRAGLITSLDKDYLAIQIKHIRAGMRAGFGSNTFLASEAGTFVSGLPRQARG